MENTQSSTKTTESSTWEPNAELLQMLMSMGINKYAAEHVC